jgi:putative salt-induced outer membrane protein YdiY
MGGIRVIKEIKIFLIILGSISFLILQSFSAFADEIVLENGDRLTGIVLRIEEGILTLETDYSEPVKIQKEKIRSISTDKKVEVHLSTDEILEGKIKTDDYGFLTVESNQARQPTAITWESIHAINPAPIIPPKWKGNIAVGADVQSGNTKQTSVSVGAETRRKTDRDRFTMRFLHNYAEESDEITVRNTYGALKYDYFFTDSFFGYLSVELLNDKFKDLNLRTVVGPGVGYQIWDDDIKSLLFELGISYFSEDLKDGEDDNWITGRFGSNFTYRLLDTIEFSEQIIVYPSIEDFGEYQLRNEASLISSLGSKLALKFANILERDSKPPDGVRKNDLYWILSVLYSF